MVAKATNIKRNHQMVPTNDVRLCILRDERDHLKGALDSLLTWGIF